MPLFARSFQDLMTDSLEDLANSTNITRLSAGGIARALLEAMNKRLSEAYDVFDLNLARAFVSSAPGQFLDLIGVLLGISRESSVSPFVDEDTQVLKFYVDSGTFGDINGGNPIVLPQGTTISTEEGSAGILYRTLAQYTLSASGGDQFIAAEAIVPGEDSNVGAAELIFHSFTGYADQLNSTLLVTNLHEISNGQNFESDANFRFRIVNRILEAEAANLTAIRLATLSTPGVADAILIPRYRGIGTVGVILKSVTPTVSDSLIASVEAAILGVASMGEVVYVRKPMETGITLRTTVHYRNRMSDEDLLNIEEGLVDEITNFINSLDIGESLLVNRLVSTLFSSSDNIANFGDPGVPIDELYVHTESRLRDTKVRQTLLGDYVPETDERIIVEPSITNSIVFDRAYTRR